ncbi:MAG: hypothetical protein M3N29_04500 [Chloroflexota bacterium]|nr:hypothetical protein [Chloroflexota bacterium]
MTEPERRSGADSDRQPASVRDEIGRRTSGAEGTDDTPSEREASAGSGQPTPTAAQLRRFIKSRPYVPLHELRRRFELNGEFDEVNPVSVGDGTIVYVGLPERESQLLGGLVRDGDIGLELSQDPQVPIVVGVYPIRPITRN